MIRHDTGPKLALAFTLLAIFAATPAAASCGSAVCLVNTNWDLQGFAAEPGRPRFDFHFEFIPQDQLRSGSTRVSSAPEDADALELKTINRNFVFALDYPIDGHWGVTATLPVVDRFHSHWADPPGESALEAWRYARIGDARINGRYQFDDSGRGAFGLQFGLKLPTGAHDVANADGVVAERTLQPGSGSTDAIVGAYASGMHAPSGLHWFVQGAFQGAVATTDRFRPGNQWTLNGGVTWPLTDRLAFLAQLNGLVKERDTGARAENELSGGRYLFASPGVTYAFNDNVTVYAVAQLPVYQYVNGTQLTAAWSAIGGVSVRF